MDIPQILQTALRNLKSLLQNRLFFIFSLILIGSAIVLYYKPFSDTKLNDANHSMTTFASSKVSLSPEITKQPLQKIDIKIQEGDNLSDVFERLGISQEQLQDIIEQKQANTELSLLQPQEKIQLLVGPNHVIQQLNFPINFKEMLQVTRNGNDYITRIIPFHPEIRLETVSGNIKESFSVDALKADLHPKQIKEFARIFADELNFKREVKPGDKFCVIYETYYSNNELIGSGDIIAAEYINRRNQSYRAIRDTDSLGRYNFYTPNGTNLRKAFVRYPLIFKRISSRFSLERAHPVMNKIVRPHKGVDFAAPIGRPVEASGDGQIIFAGTKSGYGNTIVIHHNSHYKTLYAHLDHFADGIHVGTRVMEGQVIAYVGETGIATGPHLHYEFSVDGKPRNPLTVAFPNANSVPTANKMEFAAKVKRLITLLTPMPSK